MTLKKAVRIGAHMGISGGFYKAPEETISELGANAFQIFNHSPRYWKVKTPTTEEADLFRKSMEKYEISPEDALVHSSYLINLASPKEDVYEKSIQLMIKEIEICDILKLPYLNVHPGSHLGEGEEFGKKRISKALEKIIFETSGSKTTILLEGVSPKGGNIGYTPEQIGKIFTLVSSESSERLGYCYDTCHGFDAGYDITKPEGAEKLLGEIKRYLSLEKFKMIHLNDSKFQLGEHKDRHANIGEGTIGIEGFKTFLSFPEFLKIPLILETPGDNSDHFRDIERIRTILHELYPEDEWDWKKIE